MTGPDTRALSWAAEATRARDLVVLRGLRDGGSPWLLRTGDREVVLRTGQPDDRASFATEPANDPLHLGNQIPLQGIERGRSKTLRAWIPPRVGCARHGQ